MNSNLLNAMLAKKGHRQRDLAAVLSLGLSTTNHKIQGKKAQFTQGELNVIKEHYNLTPDEMVEIFFTQKVT